MVEALEQVQNATSTDDCIVVNARCVEGTFPLRFHTCLALAHPGFEQSALLIRASVFGRKAWLSAPLPKISTRLPGSGFGEGARSDISGSGYVRVFQKRDAELPLQRTLSRGMSAITKLRNSYVNHARCGAVW